MNLKLWIIAVVALIFIGDPSSVHAQSFERGYKAFQDGNYRKARKYLIRGIKRTRDRYDKALMYKLLGISEYNLGRKSAASNSFKKAVRLDPAIKISRSESRNRRIVSLFKKIKSRSSSRKGSQMARGSRDSFRSARRGQRQASQRASRRSGSETSLITNLLPLGIPQFMQGKPLIGAAVAAGQAAGAAIFFERTTTAQTADAQALSIIQEQDADNTAYNPDDFNTYLDANEAFVLKARQEATQGLIIFAGVYAAGALEAILNPPSSRRGRAAIDDYNDEPQLAESEELESIYIAPDSFGVPSGFQWLMLPNNRGITGLLSWKAEF